MVDASTLAFLTRAVLEEKRKAEVEKAAKKKLKTMTEEEDPEGWREAYDSDGDLHYWHLRTRRGPLLTARPLLVRGGRGRRRGSAGLLGLLHTPLVAAVIVFAVLALLTLYSIRLSAGPSCQAS